MVLRLVLSLLLLGFAALAGAEEPTDAAPDTAPAPAADVSPLLHGVLELSLADAIRMGLENNLDVQLQRYSPLIAELEATEAWGAYDPVLFGEWTYEDSEIPQAVVVFGDEVERRDIFGGVGGVLPMLSTELSARFDTTRVETNSTFTTLSPQYDSGWTIEVTQPLLKDLIWNQPWTQVRSSKLAYRSSQEQFRDAVMQEVSLIETAYWNLIATAEALRVANKSLEAAQALFEKTETQYEVGVVSKVEVTEARAGVSRREVDQIVAENQYRNQQDRLIDRVLGPNLRAESSLEIRATDSPDQFVDYVVDVPAAVAQAFLHRPDRQAAMRDLERSEVQRSFARNQVLPQLDALFLYGQSGLAGTQNPDSGFVAEPEFLGGYHDSLDDLSDFPQYRAGARISIPFPNRSARANASKSDLEYRRAQTSLRRLEQSIVLDVREKTRNLLASQEAITAAQAAREAAAEQLRAEEVRLEYGESTPFEVLEREEDLVEREREEIQAFRSYHISVTELDLALGTLLRNRNIQIAEVAPLR